MSSRHDPLASHEYTDDVPANADRHRLTTCNALGQTELVRFRIEEDLLCGRVELDAVASLYANDLRVLPNRTVSSEDDETRTRPDVARCRDVNQCNVVRRINGGPR